MLWFLKVPILGWVLRKGLKKAGCFWVFFSTPACGTQELLLWNTDYCWSPRQITQFLHPSHLASHSLPQYANRENTFRQNAASFCDMPIWSGTREDLSGLCDQRCGSRRTIGHELNEGWLRASLKDLERFRMNLRVRRLLFDVTGRLISIILKRLKELGRGLLCGKTNVPQSSKQAKGQAMKLQCFLLQSLWNESFWNTLLSMSVTRSWLGTVGIDLSRINHAWSHCLLWWNVWICGWGRSSGCPLPCF